MMEMLYHSHAGAWPITFLLFFLSFIFLKAGKPKGKKVTQMILRLFFVIMVVSGAGLLIAYQFQFIYVIKGIVAIWMIMTMELILSRTGSAKGSSTAAYWLQFVIAAALVILIGFGIIRF